MCFFSNNNVERDPGTDADTAFFISGSFISSGGTILIAADLILDCAQRQVITRTPAGDVLECFEFITNTLPQRLGLADGGQRFALVGGRIDSSNGDIPAGGYIRPSIDNRLGVVFDNDVNAHGTGEGKFTRACPSDSIGIDGIGRVRTVVLSLAEHCCTDSHIAGSQRCVVPHLGCIFIGDNVKPHGTTEIIITIGGGGICISCEISVAQALDDNIPGTGIQRDAISNFGLGTGFCVSDPHGGSHGDLGAVLIFAVTADHIISICGLGKIISCQPIIGLINHPDSSIVGGPVGIRRHL